MSSDARFELDAEQGYNEYFDWQRLARQVLTPLSVGMVARYQRYDWETEALEEWHEVEPFGVTVVEGVYSSRPALRTFFDLVAWLEDDRAKRHRRQRERAREDEDWIHRWDMAELWYEANVEPSKRADLVLHAS